MMDTLLVWSTRQPNGTRRGAGSGAYVVKVHESEIADDYPAPMTYRCTDEEADELLLFDEEEAAGLAPEDLPRRSLANFALYNSEVLPLHACLHTQRS